MSSLCVATATAAAKLDSVCVCPIRLFAYLYINMYICVCMCFVFVCVEQFSRAATQKFHTSSTQASTNARFSSILLAHDETKKKKNPHPHTANHPNGTPTVWNPGCRVAHMLGSLGRVRTHFRLRTFLVDVRERFVNVCVRALRLYHFN